MITLNISGIAWLDGAEDDPTDYCAHGRVELQVNGTSFIKPEDGNWTVSAAALYLLRTLSLDHTPENDITEGNHLFPCCGFNVRPGKKKFKVVCTGCANGIDIEVRHQEGRVLLSSYRGNEVLSEYEWKDAVLRFEEYVRAFHIFSSPKAAIEKSYDRRGWQAFWREWEQRVAEVH